MVGPDKGNPVCFMHVVVYVDRATTQQQQSLATFLSFSFKVLPGLAERPQLMTLWSECSGSAGLFHTTLDRVFTHMNHRYAAVLQERHPRSADTGWIFIDV